MSPTSSQRLFFGDRRFAFRILGIYVFRLTTGSLEILDKVATRLPAQLYVIALLAPSASDRRGTRMREENQ